MLYLFWAIFGSSWLTWRVAIWALALQMKFGLEIVPLIVSQFPFLLFVKLRWMFKMHDQMQNWKFGSKFTVPKVGCYNCSVLFKQTFMLLWILHCLCLLFLQMLMFRTNYQNRIHLCLCSKLLEYMYNVSGLETEWDDPF